MKLLAQTVFVFLLLFVSLGARSQIIASSVRSATSKFVYSPVREKFWRDINQLIQSGKADQVLRYPQPDSSSNDQDEWRLAIAKALVATQAPLHAQYILHPLVQRAAVTAQVREALRLTIEIAKNGVVDEGLLEDAAFEHDILLDDQEARSMMAYFRSRSLIRKGYPEWAQRDLKAISTDSMFGEELQFDRTLQMLNNGDAAAAFTRFESLSKSPTARAITARLSDLALARFMFERKNYRTAISTYLKIDLSTRERARSLNELAWTFYYERAYGRALGVIQALRTQYYQKLVSPETLILEMLIYRELCQYAKVKDLVESFSKQLRPVYSALENRQSLEKNPQFLQIALQEGVIQKRATIIQNLRIERRQIRKQRWREEADRDAMIKFGEKRELLVDSEINRMVKSRIEPLSNWFLDLREQVWFLQYESSLRMIQPVGSGLPAYEPSRADQLRPEELFWPVTHETWLDEILDFEVIVKDACRKTTGEAKKGSGK